MKYKVTIEIAGSYDVVVDGIDRVEAEELAIAAAKKKFSEDGIAEPEFFVDVVDELDEEE